MIKARVLHPDWSALERAARAAYDADVVETAEAKVREPGGLLITARAKKEETLLFWKGGAGEPALTPGWSKKKIVPRPVFIETVDQTPTSFTMKLSTNNWLWIQLDEGRPAMQVPAGQKWTFRPMDETRTKPNELIPGTKAVFADHLITKLGGQTVKQVAPRNWADKIAKELQDKFAAEYAAAGLKLTVSVVREG